MEKVDYDEDCNSDTLNGPNFNKYVDVDENSEEYIYTIPAHLYDTKEEKEKRMEKMLLYKEKMLISTSKHVNFQNIGSQNGFTRIKFEIEGLNKRYNTSSGINMPDPNSLQENEVPKRFTFSQDNFYLIDDDELTESEDEAEIEENITEVVKLENKEKKSFR